MAIRLGDAVSTLVTVPAWVLVAWAAGYVVCLVLLHKVTSR